MKKFFKIIAIILASLLVIAILAVAGLNIYFRVSVPDFYNRATAHESIPGLNEGFIPQGLFHVSEDDVFITCGYMNDGSASRIYLYDDKVSHYVELNTTSGKKDTTHAGGVAYWEGKVFLTHDDTIAVYDWEQIKKASKNSDAVIPTAGFEVGFGAAFCYVKSDTLYVGEFYRDKDYPTPESHHMTTDSGDKHHAILCTYDLNQIKASGFSRAEPLRAYSIIDQSQGMCITDDDMLCISASWGLSFSHIHVYNEPAMGDVDGTFTLGDTKVPLYYLDTAHEQEDISLIPMCEELYFKDGKIFFTNESASNKYIFGKLTGADKVFSIDIK